MITRAFVLIVDGTYPAANGQGQAPPGRFVVIAFIEEAAGALTIKASFTVFLLVPDNRRREGFPRELE